MESCSEQHSPAQQIKTGAAIGLAFEQLELVDLPLRLSAAPGHGERSSDSRTILLQTSRERLDRIHIGRCSVGKPFAVGRKLSTVNLCLTDATLAHQRDEALHQCNDAGRLLIQLKPGKCCPLGSTENFFVGSRSRLVRCRLQLPIELSVVPGKATIRS